MPDSWSVPRSSLKTAHVPRSSLKTAQKPVSASFGDWLKSYYEQAMKGEGWAMCQIADRLDGKHVRFTPESRHQKP
jgi:hypothetical protein